MRSYNRFQTDEVIDCSIDGERTQVSLYNLSCGGCMIESPSDACVKGAPIEICLTDKLTVPGRIVWRIEKNAGIKFSAPIHQKVVEHFGYEDEEEFDRHDPRDRFGIPLVGTLHAGAGRLD